MEKIMTNIEREMHEAIGDGVFGSGEHVND